MVRSRSRREIERNGDGMGRPLLPKENMAHEACELREWFSKIRPNIMEDAYGGIDDSPGKTSEAGFSSP